ncbi:MAG: replication-relaxation family protein [Acidimicrobiia bacterium]
MKRPYLTAKRLAVLEAGMSARDRALLADVARLRLMTGGQIARLHFGVSESARRLARRELARLVEARLLVRLGRRIGGVRAGSAGYVYGLDVAGQRLARPGQRRWWPVTTPGEPFLRHVLAVAGVYVELRLAEQTGGFEVVAFEAEPACWRPYYGPGSERLTLKPDVYVVTVSLGYEDHVFIEVDLATESGPRLAAKARLYIAYFRSGTEQARSGLFPQVLWLVPDQARLSQLVDVLGRLDAAFWRLFAVATLDGAVNAITGADASGPDSGAGRELGS